MLPLFQFKACEYSSKCYRCIDIHQKGLVVNKSEYSIVFLKTYWDPEI